MRRWLLIVLAWLAAGVAVLPVVWVIITSLTPAERLTRGFAFGGLSLENYARVLSRTPFPLYIINSAVIALVTTILTLTLALAAAYALTRYHVAGRGFILALLLAIPLFPQISILIYLYLVASRLGLINTYAALIIPYTALALPLAIWYLVAALDEIPRDLDYAARLDGCTSWRVLTSVLMPLSMPAVMAVGLLIFLLTWNEFIIALVLTTDAHARTAPVGLAMFQGAHYIPWGDITAAAVVVLAPVVIIAFFGQRMLVSGLTKGALK